MLHRTKRQALWTLYIHVPSKINYWLLVMYDYFHVPQQIAADTHKYEGRS